MLQEEVHIEDVLSQNLPFRVGNTHAWCSPPPLASRMRLTLPSMIRPRLPPLWRQTVLQRHFQSKPEVPLFLGGVHIAADRAPSSLSSSPIGVRGWHQVGGSNEDVRNFGRGCLAASMGRYS